MALPGRWRLRGDMILHPTARLAPPARRLTLKGGLWQIRRSMSARYPGIARACFHLNWIFLVLWALYLLGPDAIGVLRLDRNGIVYALLAGGLFVIHFVLVSTGIIALFVVIIEVHAERPVRGVASVMAALALPLASFLYFAARYIAEVRRFLRGSP